jgi:hypothetical protein
MRARTGWSRKPSRCGLRDHFCAGSMPGFSSSWLAQEASSSTSRSDMHEHRISHIERSMVHRETAAKTDDDMRSTNSSTGAGVVRLKPATRHPASSRHRAPLKNLKVQNLGIMCGSGFYLELHIQFILS